MSVTLTPSINVGEKATGSTMLGSRSEQEFVLLNVPDELLTAPSLLNQFEQYLTAEDSSSSAWEDTTGGAYD